MVTKTCVICNSSFESPTHRHQTCSDGCRNKFREQPRWSTKNCEVCGAEFQNDKHHPKRFCDISCRNADRAKNRLKTCPTCGVAYKADRAEQVYCSHDCFGKANSGRGSRGGEVPFCVCGNPIQNKARVFCSDKCQQANQKKRTKSKPDTTHTCLACGKIFTRPWYYAGKKFYCSSKCQKHSIQKESVGQIEVRKFIESLGVTTQEHWLSSGQEVDVYCPDHKVGFEYNGAFFHSIKGLERRGVKRESQIRYHLTKTLDAQSDGIFVYHIWSWEWEDERTRPIIQSQIRTLLNRIGRKVYARKTSVAVVDNISAGNFLHHHHLIGRVNAEVHYGLFDDEELIALMSFDQDGGGWVLRRYCVKQNVSILGGASKLFTHFVREHRPNSVISYSDRAKTTGDMYDMLGFGLTHVTEPEYVNLHLNSGKVHRRQQTMRSVLLKKHPDLLNDSMTEREMCEELGFSRIYGCGKKAWKWTQS